MTRIIDNTFAAACYNDCSIADLVAALAGPADQADCATWGLTEAEWRDGIETALAAKREDREG
jgi:hypothetical protein